MKNSIQSQPFYMLKKELSNSKTYWTGAEVIKDFIEWLYTTSETERDHAKGLGFEYVGVACNVFTIQVENSIPLYRLYNGTDHFYTTSQAEKENAIRSGRYSSEGIACYVYPNQVKGSIPLYRRVNEFSHFYSIQKAYDGDPVKETDIFFTPDGPPQELTKNRPSNLEEIACFVLPPN